MNLKLFTFLYMAIINKIELKKYTGGVEGAGVLVVEY